MLLAEVMGWLGAASLLAAYALLSTGRIGPGWTYQLLNLAGSIGLAVNAVTHGAWPSAAVNVIWLVIAVVALRRAGPRPRPAVESGQPAPAATRGKTLH